MSAGVDIVDVREVYGLVRVCEVHVASGSDGGGAGRARRALQTIFLVTRPHTTLRSNYAHEVVTRAWLRLVVRRCPTHIHSFAAS